MEKRYCSHCGKEVNKEAVVCVHCGCSIKSTSSISVDGDGLKLVIQIFMILGIISSGFLLIPLIWTIPMYYKVKAYLNNEVELSDGYKVCVLLFCNLIAGILLLIYDKK